MGSQSGRLKNGSHTTWVLDLDGVVWLGTEIIPGSPEAIQKLMDSGIEVGFVTNMSYQKLGDQEAKLEAAGISAKGRVVTSAIAAASLLKGTERVLICGGAGIYEAVEATGAEVVKSEVDNPDVVITGMKPDFSNADCTRAMRAIRAGAHLIGTNHDPTYPTAEGLFPGGGAQLAAIARASETEPEIAGKPNVAMAECVKKIFGGVSLVVGDRPDSDGLFAETLGCGFGLVLSGVTQASDIDGGMDITPVPQFVSQDLFSLVEEVVDGQNV